MPTGIKDRVAILGMGCSKFGERWDASPEDLMVEAYDEALADYAKAIEIDGELGAAYLNEGAAHIYRKDFESALAPLDRAIELDTTDIFAAYYNRAIARENTGDVPGAYYDFQKALELNPGWELAERQLNRFEVQQ